MYLNNYTNNFLYNFEYMYIGVNYLYQSSI